MATIIIRPTSDTSLAHSVSPSGSGYLAIDDTSSDGDSTYIYQSCSATSSESKTSTFGGSYNFGSAVTINSITITVVARYNGTASGNQTLAFGTTSSNTSVTLSSSYQTFTYAISGGQQVSSLSLAFYLQTTCKTSKNNSVDARITQVYATVDYTAIPSAKTLKARYNGSDIIDMVISENSVDIYYGSTKKGTCGYGETKTLSCSGKVCTQNIIIGSKTLQCNGKLMATNVVVTLT